MRQWRWPWRERPTRSPLSDAVAARLRAAPYTYPDIGATVGVPTPGFRRFTRTRVLAGVDFGWAAGQLLSWQVHERAGLRVAASSPRAEPGAVVLLRLGIGPLAVHAPCRVAYVIDEPGRAGFAYGSLPGHPESGEELFLVQRDELGRVTFTVTALTRPATLLARAGGPATRWVQDWMTSRYLRALVQRRARSHQ